MIENNAAVSRTMTSVLSLSSVPFDSTRRQHPNNADRRNTCGASAGSLRLVGQYSTVIRPAGRYGVIPVGDP